MAYRSSPCRSCGAPCIWARTGADRLMPVDLEPTPDGNVELYEAAGKIHAAVVSGPSLLGGPRYTSHFATCPDSAHWRQP